MPLCTCYPYSQEPSLELKVTGAFLAYLQIIAPEQDKYIKRTPDGTPMEVALTQHLDHPNIVRTLRHASFQSHVNPLALPCPALVCPALL